MKLALGSANFGKKYSFKKKKIPFKEIKLIEKIVKKSKISLIDTADIYGASQKIIGKTSLNKLKIVTKVKFKKNNKLDPNIFIEKKILSILKDLKIERIHGVLLHDYKDTIGKIGSLNIDALRNLKKKKLVNKIGLSIYDPVELNKVWKIWRPDLVQVPLNVFDQRIFQSNWLKKLKKNNVEVHIRSCFLQGLLINYDDNKFYKKFDRWKKLLNKWSNWCYENRISRVAASIDFIKKFDNISYLIVGVESAQQLRQIIKIFNKKKIYIPNVFNSKDKNLIEPRNWE
jgi:aryl-alcohol dehydrogenase-like predicted oxidoreductase